MESKRLAVSTAEEVIDRYFPVLDHGFVALKDYMGSDYAIEESARVSYGEGTRKVSDTRTLLRYLFRHRHSSPFEMVELRFHIGLPIFVMRQLVRHRTACLAGFNQLHFDLPDDIKRRDNQSYKLSVKDVYERFHGHNFGKVRVQNMQLRCLNELTQDVHHTTITDIWSTGEKEVYQVLLAGGHTCVMSRDHLCYTDKGWMKLFEAVHKLPTQEDQSWSSDRRFAAIGPGSDAGVRLKCDFPSIQSVTCLGIHETYDIEVSGDWHNFSCGGMVVHNSLNEYSGRYSIMPMMFYTPEREQVCSQSKKNKQGRAEPISEERYGSFWRKMQTQRGMAANHYAEWITEDDIAKETARLDLPLSMYTYCYWKCDLRNLFNVMSLRSDSHAQWEIQAFSDVICGLVQRVTPLAFEAFQDYQQTSVTFSQVEMNAIRSLTCPKRPPFFGHWEDPDSDIGLSLRESLARQGCGVREIDEFFGKVKVREKKDYSLDPANARDAKYYKDMVAKHAIEKPTS